MIECSNINKSFNGKSILKSVTLNIENNSVTSLIGSNGAGKSTLIGLICGYFNIDSGEIQKIDVSVMPDAESLYEDMTGYTFLTFMSRLKKLPSNKDALELADELFINADLNKKIKDYSFGMKKKISFIQACLGTYDTYIFDEPTSGVDEPSAIKMLNIIQRLKAKGSAILLTSHNLDELERVSDYVYIISEGRIINKGTVNEIISSNNYFGDASKNLIYTLKSEEAEQVYHLISEYFQNEIQLSRDFEIEIEIENDKQLGEITSLITENNYTFSEVYIKKKTLRESVYKK